MKLQTQPLKGFRDFLPEEAVKRQWLKFRLMEIFELWGFAPLETPTLEPLELFTGQIGEDEKLFFKFTDQGDRGVALRYDQTVPTCRVIGEYANSLTFPFKRYQIQPAYRAEKPQKGRYREFIQCDADIFGVASPLADAEVIALGLDIYKRLGFSQAVVHINNRELLKDIPYEAIVAIDKLKKIGEDGVIKEMVEKHIPFETAKEYLTFIKNLQPDETMNTILAYLRSYGFDESWFVFDPTIARSFSYSMGPIWEIEIPGTTGSVLGGERFDKLVEKISGLEIAGTGFGLGFDRTLEAAETFNLIPDLSAAPQVLGSVFSPDLFGAMTTIIKSLREANINAELFTDIHAKLEKQLKYADKKHIPLVLIQGPDEAAKQAVMIKNMDTKSSRLISLPNLINELKNDLHN